MIRSTMYINKTRLGELKEAAKKIDLTKDQMIALLLSRIMRKNRFEPQAFVAKDRHFKPVKYQKSIPGIVWKIECIKFEPVFYEKALDLRRNFKFSVSWLIAYAIENYLDEIVDKMQNSKNSKEKVNNYDRNSVYIAQLLGDVQVFISILGFPEEKHLTRFIF